MVNVVLGVSRVCELMESAYPERICTTAAKLMKVIVGDICFGLEDMDRSGVNVVRMMNLMAQWSVR